MDFGRCEQEVGLAAQASPCCPPRRKARRLVVFLCVATVMAGAASAAAPTDYGLADTQVRLQEDPFRRLQAIDAGRTASTWSSLPDSTACRSDSHGEVAHGALLAEPDNAVENRTGSFDLIDPRYRAQIDATVHRGCVYGQLAVQSQVGQDGDFASMDGSALSWQISPHWRLGAGLIARQWGPAWDGSLILSPAARAFPSVALDAASGTLSDSKWWWWLGQVQFSGVLGQLESDRGDVPKPWLMGMRLVLRPWDWLELGASRTMQLGGEGRDNSLKSFLKAFLGRDNNCDGSDCSNQPGNQLGGFDARLNLDAWLPGVALYGQMIGEDGRPEWYPVPAKNMHQAGAEWRRNDALVFAEWTDSTAGQTGIAYNHSIYTDGYRYKGRPLGHWADGDSNVWTAGGLLKDLAGGQALAVARYGTLNEAGVNPTWPPSRLVSASVQWRTVIDRVFGLTIALDHFSLTGRQAAYGSSADTQRDTQLRVQLDAWLN
jgi:hypothetical protein